MRKSDLKYFIVVIIALSSCHKGIDVQPPPPPPPRDDTTCIISTISQVNSNMGTASSLTVTYDSRPRVTRLIIYDSVNNKKNFEANFNYVTDDSVRLDQYQYFKLDANGRVIRFVTKSDLSDPANADDYTFEYTYNNQEYLATKDLYINGSLLPNLSTTYTYTNNLLTKCIMVAVSSGNLKVLESNSTYDSSIKIKNWIYTFPDAIEGSMYFTVLNFGKRPSNPLKQMVTEIYDPSSGTLLDKWITNYSNYQIDQYGYVLSGEASGDFQQGIAVFYGKTNFGYDCH
ncbi:hypothetical protein FC093_01695 [Ilyomonas limi]|uniref:DUF4595 domain-containing protein n=1 Tax=Ilyomonas limi TaxID=2575867 RepID=A0A4U3L8W5_9BACT|nr:hypothetical protein [Ilyomonas limi]TKK71761.1 hypothetical protein FC093_01695 [Ilyomonas limi]